MYSVSKIDDSSIPEADPMEKVAVCLHLRTEEDFEQVLCPEQVFCGEICKEGETNGLSAPHSARAVSRERRLPAAPARTPPRASLDPPNGALTDKHLANLMIDSYEYETPLALSRLNNESDDAENMGPTATYPTPKELFCQRPATAGYSMSDSLSKASPTEKVRAKLCASVQMCVRLFLHTLVPPRSCPR
jgi:hypothetical protein